MQRRLRSISVLLGAFVLSACAGTSPSESVASATVEETTVTRASTSTSTSLSPTTTTSTTEPIAASIETVAHVVSVPSSQPAVIDGVLGEDEWADAVVFEMSDGAALRVMYSGETLYVAVAGADIGAVNVVMGTGETILILHSSAALGSALYEPGPAGWDLTYGFSWCCRDRNDETARPNLLAEEGWQANIGFTGDPGVVEYQITIPWRGSSIAVSSIRDDDDKGFWPLELSANARQQLLGAPPDTRSYETGDWYTIEPATD